MAQHTFHFLVKSGLSTKPISVENNDVGSVISAVRKTFGLATDAHVRLKAYSKEWQEYVDVDDNGEYRIEDREKLEAIVTTEVDLQNLFDTSSFCERQTDGSVRSFVSETTLDRSSDDQPHSISGTSHPTSDDPQTASSSDTDMITDWPSEFVLPKTLFPPDLRRALEKKEELSCSLRKKLVNAVFEKMRQYTWCPHPYMYEMAARSITTEYPFLADKVPFTKPYECWKVRLSDKFRNERKSVRKRGEDDIVLLPPTKKDKKNNSDKDGALPAGEDEASINSHIETMREQYSKRNPDEELVDQLMDITYSTRRAKVLSGTSVPQLLEDYPCLRWKRQMKLEMSRITEGDTSYSIFSEKLTSATEYILSKQPQDLEIQDCRLSSALKILPSLLREKLQDIVKDAQETSEEDEQDTPRQDVTEEITEAYPHIKHEAGNKYIIVAEGADISVSDSLPEAFYLLVQSYYVFNIQYPKTLKNVLSFMECQFQFKKPFKMRSIPRATRNLINCIKCN